jgi:type IV pilus assembly protein PilN
MIRINLLPVKQREAEIARRREVTLGAVILAAALLAIGAAHLLQVFQLSGLEKELAQLRGELQALNVKIKELGDLQNKIKEARGKNKIIDDLKKKKSGPVLVMENLANATPATLWLTDLKESGGSLALSGLAVDHKTVADFITGLEASKHFKGVELIETTDGVGPTAGFKKFAIKTAVLYQPPEAPAPETKAPQPAKSAKIEEKKG